MLDAGMLLMAPQVTALSLGEGAAAVGRSRRPTMVRYRAQDRRIFVAALHRKWFVRLCEIIGAPELADDPRFASHRSQTEHADELIAAIESRLSARPAADWEQEFTAAGLPASVVRSLHEILAHPHLAERGTLQQVSVPETGQTTTVVGSGVRFEHNQPTFRSGVPRLGEHTQEILQELGMGPDS
jgi:crotonobetainyl-CoA:carnitine CoA-transferase CaiB-like acyl-CoA transferase